MNFSILKQALADAVQKGDLLAESRENIFAWLDLCAEDWSNASLLELVEKKEWRELNDRFFKTLAFGTGGLRGRTVGGVTTRAEQGRGGPNGRPEYPAIGTNCMNYVNVQRATQGLVDYVKQWKKSAGAEGPPTLVFAHDPRHFSPEFSELAARTVADNGGVAYLFEGQRSTPELSFAIRQLGADAGAVITASHNPSHDNGFKAYFNDGAQVIGEHATGIIECGGRASRPHSESGKGEIRKLGREIDSEYVARLKTLVLAPERVKEHARELKIVYTPLHGTGAQIIPGLLKECGFEVQLVEEQLTADGRFPTVKSPNPENSEALELAIRKAEASGADLVIATDPDADRMGVAVRGPSGMQLLNGNQIGSILAYYRLERLFDLGVLTSNTFARACLIKTVVTTDLQRAIAERFHVRLVETLTGFKYIGAKLRKYEQEAKAKYLESGGHLTEPWTRLSEEKKRALLLDFSSYYVFGGEESYGYSASDFVRDKDANAAALMFAEMAVVARARGNSVLQFLDSIYSQMGFFVEKLGQLVYAGAEGAAKIQRLLLSYEKNPPSEFGGRKVVRVRDHAKEEIRDIDGDVLPKETMFFFELAGGVKFAVRGSGTEPKIKYYFFASRRPDRVASFTPEQLAAAKRELPGEIDQLWETVKADAEKRAQ
ncbi:MAG: phospho-sugar mutase [Verrucomicrobiae bacterium]|nr:phospho-sugar mutase [Verrucomicrobiae bacterium]